MSDSEKVELLEEAYFDYENNKIIMETFVVICSFIVKGLVPITKKDRAWALKELEKIKDFNSD